MDYLGGFLPKRKFPTPAPPTAVSFQSLTANGTSGTVSTTQLTATFDIDPGLTTANFVVTGASKGTVSKVDNVYTININTITVLDGQSVTLDIIGVPSGFTITPTTRTVVVNKAAELEAPTVIATLDFPQATIGVPFSFSIAYVFAGEIDTYEVSAGTLPSWATLNASTGLITGTPDAESTAAGLSFTATNAAGTSDASNTANLTTVESVVGEGITYDPALFGRFYGSPNVNVTGIVIDDITVFPTPDTVPKVLRATLYDCIRWSGTRIYNSFGYELELPLTQIRHTDLDYRWKVAYEDGSPIEDNEGLLRAFTLENANPYLDQIGTILSAVGRRPGIGYKITGYVYGKNGDLIRGTSFEKVIPAVSDNALPTTFMDWEFGDDLNDGLDPLGLSLSGATYDDATRTITLVGGFTTYDHAAATSNNETQWFNKLYLLSATEPGFTPLLVDIESKTSNDAVVIKQTLGANYTGVTSSNGPKLNIQVRPLLDVNNTRQCPKLGGDYSIADDIDMGKEGIKEFIAWGADGLSDARIIKSTTGAITDFSSGMSDDVAGTTWFTFSRITLDGEYTKTLTTGSTTSAKEIRDCVLLWDRSTLKGSSGGQTFGYISSGDLRYDHMTKMMFYGGEMNNLADPLGTNNKTNGMFFANTPNSWFSIVGTVLKSDNATGEDGNHYMYPTWSLSNCHMTWARAVEGEGANYVVNGNIIFDSQNFSIVQNYFGAGARNGLDVSITNETFDARYANDVYFVDNDCNVQQFAVNQYSAQTIRAAYNRCWVADAGGQAFFGRGINWMPADYRPRNYLDNNKVYGQPIVENVSGIDYYEMTDNEVWQTANNEAVELSPGTIVEMESKVDRNNFYAPNKGDGNIIYANSTAYTVEGFNTAYSASNTNLEPEWVDPANGDFSTPDPNTYFTDFSTDTIGSAPANTTFKRNTVEGDYQVIDESGLNVLRFDSTGTENARGLAFSALTAAGVTEIFARGKDSDTNPASLRLVAFASDGPDNEYGVQLSSLNDNVVIYKRVAGTFTQLTTNTLVQGTASYRNILLRITPGSPNTIQVKVWVGDPVTDEPVSWLASPTDSGLTLSAGWIGTVGFDNALPVFYECFGIGVNGDPAPRS